YTRCRFVCPPMRTLLTVFFLPAPATPRFSTLSLHDALPISVAEWCGERVVVGRELAAAKPHGPFWLILDSVGGAALGAALAMLRSEEHTSELQSRGHLVCRLLLEKKKTTNT